MVGSLGGILFTSWPISQVRSEIPFIYDGISQGTLYLTIPEKLLVGDRATISLQVDYKPAVSDAPGAETIDLINRLEMGSIKHSPKGQGHVSMVSDSTIILKWEIVPIKETSYSGVVWLFQQLSDQSNQLILARQIDLQAISFLGLPYGLARWFCVILFLVSASFLVVGMIKKVKRDLK